MVGQARAFGGWGWRAGRQTRAFLAGGRTCGRVGLQCSGEALGYSRMYKQWPHVLAFIKTADARIAQDVRVCVRGTFFSGVLRDAEGYEAEGMFPSMCICIYRGRIQG